MGDVMSAETVAAIRKGNPVQFDGDAVEGLCDSHEELRLLLREYGRHDHGCSAEHGAKYRCRCGWREVAAALFPEG